MDLPDINIWLALANTTHPHYPRALNWFQSVGQPGCAFCRVSQMGFLRLSTNKRVPDIIPVSIPDAWSKFDQFLLDPRVVYADEPPNIDPVFRHFMLIGNPSPNKWTDTYLAAFAVVSGYRFVTFDQGIPQYPGLNLFIP